MNLFCLPFAGGSRYSFKGFQDHASEKINVLPIELPGRGSRLSEPLVFDITALVEDVFIQIRDSLNEPYMILGHSMGSLLGYLLVKKIINEGYDPPQHLFVGGCAAPSVRKEIQIRSELPRDLFIAKLKEYGGSPDQVLENDELMDLFEPIIRADFRVVETFQHSTDSNPFHIPIDVFLGAEENVSYQDGILWSNETTSEVRVTLFPGHHFFIFGQEKAIMKIIEQRAESKSSLSKLWV